MKKIIVSNSKHHSKTATSSKKSAKESSTTSRQSASPKGSAKKKPSTSKPSSGSSARSSARSSAKSSTASKKPEVGGGVVRRLVEADGQEAKQEIVIYCPVPKSGNTPDLALHIAVSVASGVPLFASPKKRVVRYANVKRNGNAE